MSRNSSSSGHRWSDGLHRIREAVLPDCRPLAAFFADRSSAMTCAIATLATPARPARPDRSRVRISPLFSTASAPLCIKFVMHVTTPLRLWPTIFTRHAGRLFALFDEHVLRRSWSSRLMNFSLEVCAHIHRWRSIIRAMLGTRAQRCWL